MTLKSTPAGAVLGTHKRTKKKREDTSGIALQIIAMMLEIPSTIVGMIAEK
jgi:hypothetical protein